MIAKDEEKWVPIEETRISMTVKPDVDIATVSNNKLAAFYLQKVRWKTPFILTHIDAD